MTIPHIRIRALRMLLGMLIHDLLLLLLWSSRLRVVRIHSHLCLLSHGRKLLLLLRLLFVLLLLLLLNLRLLLLRLRLLLRLSLSLRFGLRCQLSLERRAILGSRGSFACCASFRSHCQENACSCQSRDLH